jgi:hypothetical protein
MKRTLIIPVECIALTDIKRYLTFFALLVVSIAGFSQVEPLWTQDTAFLKDLYVMTNKFHSLSFTGYLQVQYQNAGSPGIKSYNGGDFNPGSDNRFMIRRGRFRIDYDNKTDEGFYKYFFALQFDGSERGVNIRDMFGRVYENKWHYFVATFGMFNRPFSHELNYSSSMRESPERGRMSQILMKTERDIGAMLSFEPQDRNHKLYPLKVDAGFFNGQGLSGSEEFDSYKDFIFRVSMRRTAIARNLNLSGGLSYLNGGIRNGSGLYYRMSSDLNGAYAFKADSAAGDPVQKSPRIYYGADAQITYESRLGRTEIRGEYISGTQSATAGSSATPGILPVDRDNKPAPVYIRAFNGAYFYLLHTIQQKHQFFLKYDWYDPNILVKGTEITHPGTFTEADIRFDTFGAGYIFYLSDNVKLVFYYDHPLNEKTGLPGYSADLNDDTFTCRIQYRF